jgi:integrase
MAWLTEAMRTNRATGRKEPYFAIQWRERGHTRTRGLGFIPKAEAGVALKVFEARLATGVGVDPPPSRSGSSREAEPRGYTLARYLDEVYLPVVRRDKAPKTAVSAQTAANALKAMMGEMALSAISYATVDRYLTSRRAQGRMARTLIIELWVLRGCLQHAADSQLLSALPKLPTVKDRDRRRHRYLSPEETRALLAALKPPERQAHVTRGAPPLRYDALSYLAVLGCLNTGARKNEMLTRGWEDVRWDHGPHGTLIIGAKPEIGFRTKTGHDRAVPLTPELREALTLRHAQVGCPSRGLIFPRDDDPTRPRADFRSAVEGACRRAGLPTIHPHGLRHTWATRLAMAGVDRRTLMELGGWTDSRMLDEVYAHAPDAHRAQVMARMGISEVPPGPAPTHRPKT